MTNGEKIQTILDIDQDCTEVYGKNGMMTFSVPQDWWNAEYKEPTTKNKAKYCDRNICLKNEYNNIGCEDCEVTKSQEPTTRNCFGCKYSKDNHNAGTEKCHLCMWENQYTPTTKNDLAVDYIDRAQAQTEIEMNAFRYTLAKERGGMGQVEWSDLLIKVSDAVDIIRNLPSVIPSSSELAKNSKKLEKDFGELDCISRADVLQILLDYDYANENALVLKDIKALPSIIPQPCEDAISRQALLNATVHKNSIWNKITDSKGDNLETIISKLPPVTPQEPILDKIRAEILDCLSALDEIEKSGLNIYLPNEMSGRRLTYQQCLEFINKYKAEKE